MLEPCRLLWGLPFALVVMAQSNCEPPSPLAFPIRNVTLSGGGAVARRGLEIGVGSPQQSMSLAINGDWNNTVLWTTVGQCDNLTVQQCTFDRGGAFDNTSSTSFQSLATSGETETRPDDTSSTTTTALGIDDLVMPQLNSSISLGDFTFFTPAVSDPPQSGLGLGRNSTLLDRLFAAKTIASRSWSLFWGLEGGSTSAQMDGSLVLGGYDAAKTTGQNLTSDFANDIGCPSSLVVYLNDISLNFKNGTNASLFGSSQGTAMRTCVKPDISLITFPSSVWSAFTSLAGGTFVAPSDSYKLWGMDYKANDVFDGDMVFTLSSGLKITVPNDQLVVPDVTVSQSGQTEITDSDVREILIYNLEASNVDDMPLLGQVFLTSAYLYVDNDAEQFTLWQAQPTNETQLVTVAKEAATCTNSSGGSTSSGSPNPASKPGLSTSSTGSTDSGHNSHTGGVTTGAAVGIAIGVLAGTACVVALVLWRWRKGSMQPRVQSLSEEPMYNTYKEAVVEIAQPDRESAQHSFRQSAPRELASEMVHEMAGSSPCLPEMSAWNKF